MRPPRSEYSREEPGTEPRDHQALGDWAVGEGLDRKQGAPVTQEETEMCVTWTQNGDG